jgi:hypothetical protein
VDAALSHAEAILGRRARIADIEQDSGSPSGGTSGLPTAVLIAAPSPAATWRLRAVLESGLPLGLAAILLASWTPGVTCHVAADGTLASTDPALDGGQLFHLGDADTTAVISLLQAPCTEPATEDDPRPDPRTQAHPGPLARHLPRRRQARRRRAAAP